MMLLCARLLAIGNLLKKNSLNINRLYVSFAKNVKIGRGGGVR
jgi:hypothetical protein